MNRVSETSKSIGIIKSPFNKKLIELFKSRNKKVFDFPVIKTERAKLNEEQSNYFENISRFDWIIFTDIWTVENFFGVLEEKNIELFDLDGLRICSCGEAVADGLRFRQIHSDVIPPKNTNEIIFSAISDYIFDEDEFRNSVFLILKAAGNDSELKNLLAKKSDNVVEIEIYKDENADEKELSKLKALIIGGAIDEFVFNAPEDVFTLSKIVGKADFSRILSDIQIQALNEVTLQTLSEFGLNPQN